MAPGLPLVSGRAPGAVFARREGRSVATGEFLRDVLQAAAALPERRYALNLCADRYRFAVGLAAALVRGQLSLLPSSHAPDLLARLAAAYRGLYCLRDDGREDAALESVAVSPATGEAGAAAPAMPLLSAAQPAVVVFTSGSTGEPIPHLKTWGSLAAGARAEADRLKPAPGLALIGTVPPQHVYGLESTVLLALQGGCVLHAGRPFYPYDIRDALEATPAPRALVTTPVHLRVLLAEPDPVPKVDFVLCATAPLAPQLAQAAERRFGAPLYEIYGCTEAGQIASRRTTASDEWRALAGVEARADERGAWVKGGHVETEVLLSDVIELRGRSRFLLHGRTADLVNIAGKRASLAYLNFHLNSIEGVRDGAYLLPEEAEGDATRLTAFVVAPGLTREAILAALRSRIDPAFLPRPLRLVDELPRNATGKLPRQALDELARKAG
jgi:acyl-coenzyme A synthetase/AMP-(fatty) acid ligase